MPGRVERGLRYAAQRHAGSEEIDLHPPHFPPDAGILRAAALTSQVRSAGSPVRTTTTAVGGGRQN